MDTKNISVNIIIDYLLLIILCFSPVVISIGLFTQDDLNHPVIGIQLSFSDLLIILVLTLLSIKLIKDKSLASIKWPPKSVFGFLAAMMLSALSAANFQAVVKEILQTVLYFIILYTILLQRASHRSFLKKVSLVLICLVFISVVLASFQCFIEQGSPYLIRALFSNRNLLGGFFVLVLPLLFSLFLVTEKIVVKIALVLLILCAFIVIYAPFAILSVLAGFIMISILYSKKSLWVLTVFLLTIIISVSLSDRQRLCWEDAFSVYEIGSIGENYSRVQRFLFDLPRNVWILKSFGDKKLIVKNDLFMSSVEPQTRSRIGKYIYSHLGEQRQIKQRYLEWQAALNMVTQKSVIGFGGGNYQSLIGYHYGTLPKVNTMEPNTDNQYLVLAATVGVLGLGMFVWVLMTHFRSALMIAKGSSDRFNKIIGLWGSGSLLGISIYAFFTSFMVVGLMPFFIMMAAAVQRNLMET